MVCRTSLQYLTSHQLKVSSVDTSVIGRQQGGTLVSLPQESMTEQDVDEGYQSGGEFSVDGGI